MKVKHLAAALTCIFVGCFLSLSVVAPVMAQDISLSYQFVDQSTGATLYTLNVVIPPSLTEYYGQQSHRSASDADFSKFVTPFALVPIANCLREIYPDDEDFVNGVLTLVHQIPYEVIIPASYPVEVLLGKKGDCDLFSFVAASLFKAGGLDAVLLHYTSREHMNVGVHLSEVPKNSRTGIYSVTHFGVKYYVAECTSSNWRDGWRVGESPEDLKTVSAAVLALDQIEQVAPGQVSASFKRLEGSSLGLSVSPFLLLQGSSVTAQGQISPSVANQNVTFYISSNGDSWSVIGSTVTGVDGCFEFVWSPVEFGFLELRAGWVGNDVYAGSTSLTVNSLFFPFWVVLIAVVALVVVVISVVAYLATRSRSKASTSVVAG